MYLSCIVSSSLGAEDNPHLRPRGVTTSSGATSLSLVALGRIFAGVVAHTDSGHDNLAVFVDQLAIRSHGFAVRAHQIGVRVGGIARVFCFLLQSPGSFIALLFHARKFFLPFLKGSSRPHPHKTSLLNYAAGRCCAGRALTPESELPARLAPRLSKHRGLRLIFPRRLRLYFVHEACASLLSTRLD